MLVGPAGRGNHLTHYSKARYLTESLNFRFLTKISIFGPNFDFWTKFRFLDQISIFGPNFYFLTKFQLLEKIFYFFIKFLALNNFRFFDKFRFFYIKFQHFYQKFHKIVFCQLCLDVFENRGAAGKCIAGICTGWLKCGRENVGNPPVG